MMDIFSLIIVCLLVGASCGYGFRGYIQRKKDALKASVQAAAKKL